MKLGLGGPSLPIWGWREELTASLANILQRGFLSCTDGERLRSRLQFAENQIAGKQAGLAYKELFVHVAEGGGFLSDRLSEALVVLKDGVLSAPPRLVSDRSKHTFHLYVDASREDGPAGGEFFLRRS